MHPPLERPHPDCQEVIANLIKCHEDNPYAKFFGACNEAKVLLDKCFKVEKEKKRKANFERAKASDAYVRQKIKERRERTQSECSTESSNA